MRNQSYERSSLGTVGVDPVTTEIFAAGIVAATKALAADRLRAPLPRQIGYHDDSSQRSSRGSGSRSLDENIRIHDEIRIRDDMARRDNIQPLDDFGRRDDFQFREDIRIRNDLRDDYPTRDPPNVRIRNSLPRDDHLTRDHADVRIRHDLPRDDFLTRDPVDIRVRQDEGHNEYPTHEDLRYRHSLRRAEDDIHRNSVPFTRGIPLRGSLSTLPLEHGEFGYVRNPFNNPNPFAPDPEREFRHRNDRYP
jgi:hypothetical protein